MPAQDNPGTIFFENGVRATGAVTVQRSPEDLYQVWHEFSQLPRFIDELESVVLQPDGTTVWTLNPRIAANYTWQATTIKDTPADTIAWRTTDNAEVQSAGSVRFRQLPFARGTEVRVTMEYVPPSGSIGNAVAKAVGADPQIMVRKALHQFRMLMEAGEVATTQGQPVGANTFRTDRPGEAPRNTDPDVRDLSNTETNS